jgi:hypothetical protein
MTCSRYALVVLVLMAAACGGAVSTASDGTGGGPAAGGTGGTASVGGAGSGTGGSTDIGGSTGTGGMAGTTKVDAATCGIIRASDYDQSCNVDSDCAGVFSGNTCVDCPCPNATINKNAAAGYHPLIPVGGPACECAVSSMPPRCVGGVCTNAAPACGVIRASDYDQSCKSAQDCTTIFEGDTCTSQCACPNATINKMALASYHPVFVGTGVCNCGREAAPSCVSGVCCPASGCPAKDSGTTDPLVGTWTFGGNVPDQVNIFLTLKSDKTFTFVETVAPWEYPAGYVPNGCVTTDTHLGTYAESVSGGTNTLTWTFAGGTANAISGCNDASMDSAGTPMTPDAIASYRNQGLIPPTTTTYTATSTTLVLTSPDNRVGIGRNPGTTFTKVVLLP